MTFLHMIAKKDVSFSLLYRLNDKYTVMKLNKTILVTLILFTWGCSKNEFLDSNTTMLNKVLLLF